MLKKLFSIHSGSCTAMKQDFLILEICGASFVQQIVQNESEWRWIVLGVNVTSSRPFSLRRTS